MSDEEINEEVGREWHILCMGGLEKMKIIIDTDLWISFPKESL